MTEKALQPLPGGTRWNTAFVIDVVMNADLKTALEKHSIPLDEFLVFKDHPAFRKECEKMAAELASNGLTFQQKAAAQAEAYLSVVHEIVTDTTVGAATRLDAIKTITDWSRLVPKGTQAVGPTGPGFTINITLGGEKKTLDITPAPLEHDDA